MSLWLLRRANSDVALVVLAFALPAPLLDMLRANSTALRGKRQWSYLGDYTRDRGGPLPTVDTQGELIWPRSEEYGGLVRPQGSVGGGFTCRMQ